mmetsp:Transcript_2578/g.4752  ORF Transcript_2578/g.4752 Transcript_2578/m.4752 type:complete len:475 (+) Transcript_2578:70-1494(+)
MVKLRCDLLLCFLLATLHQSCEGTRIVQDDGLLLHSIGSGGSVPPGVFLDVSPLPLHPEGPQKPMTVPGGRLRSSRKPKPRIVGGSDAGESDYDFFVQLLGRALCGGTLITPDVVLTAAHCLSSDLEYVGVNTWEFNRFVGFLQGDAQRVRIADVERHPRFNIATFSDNDFMLLRLEEQVSNVAPVKLHEEFDLPGGTNGEYVVIGLGRTNPEIPLSLPDVLQELSVVEIPFDDCDDAFDGILNEAKMFCAGVPGSSEESTCQGDSGGPLLYYDENQEPSQLGIVSFGKPECAQEEESTVYARVSGAFEWIQEVVCGKWGSFHSPLCDEINFGRSGVAVCDDDIETLFQFAIRTDDNGAALSWDLRDRATDEVIREHGNFTNEEVRFYEGCLSKDTECYTLTIYDSGDNPGFCCNESENSNTDCCNGFVAGFLITFGDERLVRFDNPVWEGSSVSIDLCTAAPAEERAAVDHGY